MRALRAWFRFASDLGQAYLPAMLLAMRLMRIVAILLAPLSMMGSPPTMAQPQAPASASHHEQTAKESGHCAEMRGEDEDADGSDPRRDCLLDCDATCAAIPALGSAVRDQTVLAAMAHLGSLMSWMRGLIPETIDPPPRAA
jgi:hypothetical protein